MATSDGMTPTLEKNNSIRQHRSTLKYYKEYQTGLHSARTYDKPWVTNPTTTTVQNDRCAIVFTFRLN